MKRNNAIIFLGILNVVFGIFILSITVGNLIKTKRAIAGLVVGQPCTLTEKMKNKYGILVQMEIKEFKKIMKDWEDGDIIILCDGSILFQVKNHPSLEEIPVH